MKKFWYLVIGFVICFSFLAIVPSCVVNANAANCLSEFEQSNVLIMPTSNSSNSGTEIISLNVSGVNSFSITKNTLKNITVTASINMDPLPDIGNGFLWHLKTPNSTAYKKIYTVNKNNATGNVLENVNTYFSSENGFGEYKLFASAKTSAMVITSNVITFEVKAGELDLKNMSKYSITKQVVNNSKAEVEAFSFLLNNAKNDWLDYGKIVWYVNGEKTAVGESFVYQPETTESFKLEVKYETSNTSIAEITIKPNSTGTIKLLLIIAGVVVVLSGIFAISVKALNKKRDVVW